jgi:membrane protease YdiL (CAAX protease family)
MNKSVRNIIIFSLSAILGGWLGIWLNNVTDNTQPPLQSLGALVWLATPTLTGLLLRALGGDGWKDSGFGPKLISGWKWYLAALCIYPVLTLIGFGISLMLGTIQADGFATLGFSAYLSVVGVTFVGSLVKNIFEELAWRGYLTPRLDAVRAHPLLNYAITAVVWWAWHLPYYDYFLDRADLKAATPYGVPVFLVLGLLVLYPTAIFFGEIRLASKSVWTTFLLHGMINAISMPFLLNGFITSNHWGSLILSPTDDSIFMAILMGAVGYGMYKNRTKKRAAKSD